MVSSTSETSADVGATTGVACDAHPTSANECAQVTDALSQVTDLRRRLHEQVDKVQRSVLTPASAGKKRKSREEGTVRAFAEAQTYSAQAFTSEQKCVLLEAKVTAKANNKPVKWAKLSKLPLFDGFAKRRLKTAAESLLKEYEEKKASEEKKINKTLALVQDAEAKYEALEKQHVAEVVALRQHQEEVEVRHQKEVEKLRKAAIAAEQELASNKGKIARANEDVASMTAALKKIEKEKIVTTQRMHQLQATTKQTQEELEGARIADQAVAISRKQATAAEKRLTKLKWQLADQTKQLEAITAQEEAQQKEIAHLSALLAQRTAQQEALKRENEDLTNQLHELQAQSDDSSPEVIALKETWRLCCEVDEKVKLAAYEVAFRSQSPCLHHTMLTPYHTAKP